MNIRTNIKIKFFVMIVLILLLNLIPYKVNANINDNFAYELENGEISITGITNESLEKIIIPSTIDGYKVTSVGNNAFANCELLEEVIIPDTVKSIGDSVFLYCKNLKKVKLSNNITSIGEFFFYECNNLQEIDLPEKLTYIGKCAFQSCVKLKSIDLPDGLVNIEWGAFYECKGLTSINIPSKVSEIKSYVFYNCTNLEEVNLSNNITSIGDTAFGRCQKITTIKLPNNLLKIDKVAFASCIGLKEVTIPEKVSYIGETAFASCTNLIKIKIPNSVVFIGKYAFQDCKSLKEITLPSDLTKINDKVFSGCKKLERVNINKKLEKIGNYSFENCIKLTSIELPDSIKNISYNAFFGHEDLVLIVKDKSYAQKYAKNNKFEYKLFLNKVKKLKYTSETDFIDLNWCKDKKAIGYVIYLNSVKFGETKKTKFKITDLKSSTIYKIKVVGYIKVGKNKFESPYTNTLNITTKPKKVKNLKVKTQSTKSITINWSKLTGVTGYKIYSYNYKKKKYEYLGKTSDIAYKIKKLKVGITYKFKVRAYKTLNNKQSFGDYSASIETSTKTLLPENLKLSTKNKKVTVKWKRVAGASGYQIYMSTSKNGKYERIKITLKGSTVSYTKTKLKKNKKYYFKVRTYRTIYGKKIFSDYSSIKSIKVK